MKFFSTLSSVTTLAVYTSIALTACAPVGDMNCSFTDGGNSAVVDKSISVIVAPSENFIDFSSALENVSPGLEQAIAEGDVAISLVTGDGKPRVFSTQTVALDETAQQIEIDRSVRSALQPLKRMEVCLSQQGGERFLMVAESDLFSALGQAVRSFPEGSTGDQNRIVLIGNGLITSGQWSFVENGGIPSPENLATVIDEITSAGIVPDLNGATVDIYGLGQTNPAGTMEPLTNPTRDALRNFWTALIEANNGVIGVFEDGLVEQEPSGSTFPATSVESLPTPCLDSQILNEQSGFAFKPDSTEFVDKNKAVAVADQVVESVIANKCVKSITVTGFVASGTSKSNYDKDDGQALSKRRAEAFASLLNNAGLPKSTRVTTVGGGKGPYVDWSANGDFNEKAGARNRFAVVSFGE